jgi:sigma-B regulation protein RsbU (phosphoserine phosphatase)
MLTTAFYLVADWRSGVMRYANAGHPKPLHVRREEKRVEPLTNASGKGQPALGLFPGALYQSSEVRLAPKDLIMLFTDGLYEVHNQNGELYSPAELVAGVQRRAQLPPGQLFDELLAEIRRFSGGAGFTDDVCLVGMETVM